MQASADVSPSPSEPARAPPSFVDEPSADDQMGDRSTPAGLQAIDERVRTFVAERPAAALLGAVAVGFVVGRLLSRV